VIRVRELLDTAIAAFPDAATAEAGGGEDAPIPFDVSELPDLLEGIARSSGSGHMSQFVASLAIRIRGMLEDSRLRDVLHPDDEVSLADWLADYIGDDEAKNGQVVILDVSLVAADVLHLVVATIARLILEASQRYRKLNGTGLPTTLVLEEAHNFIRRPTTDGPSDPAADECRSVFERIAREGRKFGVGLVLSSQRPSEVSETVLAQCNTFLLHRIVNDRDRSLVGRLVPDQLTGLLGDLPSLPSRQAILLGWAAPLPVLVEMRALPPDHQPQSSDPDIWAVWTGGAERPISWLDIVADWQEPKGASESSTDND
jgi:DNA helicase HerA-like ATPase